MLDIPEQQKLLVHDFLYGGYLPTTSHIYFKLRHQIYWLRCILIAYYDSSIHNTAKFPISCIFLKVEQRRAQSSQQRVCLNVAILESLDKNLCKRPIIMIIHLSTKLYILRNDINSIFWFILRTYAILYFFLPDPS